MLDLFAVNKIVLGLNLSGPRISLRPGWFGIGSVDFSVIPIFFIEDNTVFRIDLYECGTAGAVVAVLMIPPLFLDASLLVENDMGCSAVGRAVQLSILSAETNRHGVRDACFIVTQNR